MKNIKKLLFGLLILILIISAFSFYSYRHQQQLKLLNTTATELITEQNVRLKTLVSAFQFKYTFLKKTILKPGNKEFFELITILENFKINSQGDFEKFEFLNNNLNQMLVDEVVLFNQKKKSLIKTSEQVRGLERYDRHIDFTRSGYSQWTYKIETLKTEIGKKASQNSSFPDIFYFKVDHLILSKKSTSDLSKKKS